MAESKSALLNLSFDGLSDMRSPKIECFFPFFKEFMPLVNGRYARNRPRLMKSPTSNSAKFVDGALSPSELLEPLSRRGSEDVRLVRASFD